MRDLSRDNFGLLIAFILPGVLALSGLSFFSPTVESWFAPTHSAGPTVGGFLLLTVASIGAGLIASTLRWLLIDALHHRTGIPEPKWEFSRLAGEVVPGFEIVLQGHYRYYQFYGNTMIAGTFVYVCLILSDRRHEWWMAGVFASCQLLLWLGSRHSLRLYYRRTGMLLADRRIRVEEPRLVIPERPSWPDRRKCD